MFPEAMTDDQSGDLTHFDGTGRRVLLRRRRGKEVSLSIYATLWSLKFPRYGDTPLDCEWEEVIGQGVPAHIGTPTPGYGYESGDPYASFLPPAVPVSEGNVEGTALRAVVVVLSGTVKVGQEYTHPLLVLSGQEYATIPFQVLCERICDALCERTSQSTG